MSEINEAESNLIHEVGNNEVESTITMSTSNDDRTESSITMKPRVTLLIQQKKSLRVEFTN